MKANIQNFDWGMVEWIHEPNNTDNGHISIGIVTIHPNKKQLKHIHYGNEQVIYVLSGRGEQIIEEKTSLMEPGSIFYIKSGATHESINNSDAPLRELLISIPRVFDASIPREYRTQSGKEVDIKIDEDITEVFHKLTQNISVQISVLDDMDSIIYNTEKYPAYCIEKCGIDKDITNCYLYRKNEEYLSHNYQEAAAFVCIYGITVYEVPIKYDNINIGVVKGGHIREPKTDLSRDQLISDLPYDTPKSTVNAILGLMNKLSRNIVDFYILKNTEIELSKKDEIINDIIQNELQLEEHLKKSQSKILNIQINNHFLFNTLNAIAGLAIRENSLTIYDAIINLSKMFRYSLRRSNHIVEFKEEIEYLKNYINLQKLRYDDTINVEFITTLDVDSVLVPFNFLQTIVENSFVHGFDRHKNRMNIVIEARKLGDNVSIKISDDGCGMDEVRLSDLRDRLRDESRISNGLSMVVGNLRRYYGNGFSLDVDSTLGQGTEVTIVIPDKIV